MDEAEKEAIRRFLRDFKQIATAVRGVDIVDRRKNMQSLAQLGLTKRNCIAMILGLSVEDYCDGPKPDKGRPGEIWEFGQFIEGKEVYIKPSISSSRSPRSERSGSQSVSRSTLPSIRFVSPAGKNEKKGGITMKGICPNCEKQTELELIHATEVVVVRGESIPIDMEYYKCRECGEEFEDPGSHDDPLDKAYREYRRRHNVMQPEEIKALRKRYGLTQNEMSRLLGWGGATLSRYENGALQDDAHEKTLRLATEPHNLLRLIEESPNTLPEEKKQRLMEQLRSEEEEAYSFERIYEERFGKYEADELSGYRKFELSKLINAILFFCKEGILKTFLNKLLFYADFKHYKEYTVSITGARYARLPYGPAPDNWNHYLALLTGEDALRVEEVFYADEIIGEKLIAESKPDLALFSDTELKILASIKEYFKDWSAKKISDFSHDEKGYVETPHSKLISYTYAKDLQI